MNRISATVDRTTFVNYLQWLYRQGFTLDEISGCTGLEITRIRKFLEDSGIGLKSLYESVLPDQIKAALAAYSKGATPVSIKEKFGFSIHEFRDICTLRNCPEYEELDETGKLFRQKIAWSLRKAGKKYHEIQLELGLKSKQAVGSLIEGYEEHIKRLEKSLMDKTINGLYAEAVLIQISEILNTDSDTVVSRIRAILGKE